MAPFGGEVIVSVMVEDGEVVADASLLYAESPAAL